MSNNTISFDSIRYAIPEHYGLRPETQYILTCFDSNIYIITNSEGTGFKVDRTLGEPLKIFQEYLIIEPKY